MGKRGVLGALVTSLLVLAAVLIPVTADHSSNLTLNPLSQYETTSQQYDVNVNNLNSKDVITQMIATIPGFEITGAVGYGGWQSDFSGNTIRWYGGTVESNVINALFQFLTRAPVVDADTSYTVTIDTKDSKNFTQTHTFTLTIKNDATPPVLSVTAPQDNSFVLKGNNLDALISAADPETGIKSVQLSWSKCGVVNATTNVNLACTGSNCTGTMNLSGFVNNDQICFTTTATNNGNAQSSSSGKITIDGEAPTITLITPAEGAQLNGNSNFRFLATDNLAPTLACTFNVDGAAQTTVTAANGNTTNVTALDATEGTHKWSVTCKDQVGLSATSPERTYILDKTPPVVTANKTNNSIIREGSLLPFLVTDNNDVASVQFVIGNATITGTPNTSINTSGMQEGKKTIEVIAADAAGNGVDQIFIYYVDKTAPVFASVISPGNESDVNTSFIFTVTDNLDATLACTVFVDSQAKVTKQIGAGIQSTIIALITPGDHTWYLQCADDADNTAATTPQIVTIIDTSGPFITITPLGTMSRGSTVRIAAEVIDYSGVKFVNGVVATPANDQIPLTLSQDGTNYTAQFPTTTVMPLGAYTITFTAQDNKGYNSTQSISFNLTYGYIITLSLDPATVSPGDVFTLNVLLRKDDGSVASSTIAVLDYLGNASNITLDTSGSVAVQLLAPDTQGSYDITLTYTDQEGIIASQTIAVTVAVPSSSSNGDSGGGNTRGRTSQSTIGGSFAPSVTAPVSAPAAPSISYTGNAHSEISSAPTSTPQTAPISTPQSVVVPNPGVGQAVGFFSLANLRNQRFWWSLLGILALILTLVFLGRKGHLNAEPVEKPADPHNWDSYLDHLAKKRP